MILSRDEIRYDVADRLASTVIEIEVSFAVVGGIGNKVGTRASELPVPAVSGRASGRDSLRQSVFINLKGFRSSGNDEFARRARAVWRREAEGEFLIFRGRRSRIPFERRSRQR